MRSTRGVAVRKRRRRDQGVLALLRWIVFADAPRRRRNVKRALLRELMKLLTVAATSAACQYFGVFERFERVDFDRHERTSTSRPSDGIALVLLSDDDYKEIFHRRSPLEAAEVGRLVTAICRFNPRVIGVDLLTADWTEAETTRLLSDLPSGCPVVWIPDVRGTAAERTSSERTASAGRPLQLDRVLGRPASAAGVCAAVAAFEPDTDGVIRRYSTHYPTVDSDAGGSRRTSPTLVWALARSDAGSPPCLGNDRLGSAGATDGAHAKRIRFSASERFVRLHARHVLDAVHEPTRFRELEPVFRTNRTVIVGGAYRQARDAYRTPIGVLHGAEIVASAVFTERSPRNEIVDVPWYASFALDVAVGVFLLALMSWWRLRWPWAIAVSSLLVIAASLVISWSVFNYLGYFVGVSASLAGVVLGVIVDVSWDPLADEWRRWRAQLRSRVATLYRGET